MSDPAFAEQLLDWWDFDDPAGSQARFAAAAAAEPVAARRASLLTQVARAQGMQDAFDAGQATLDALGEPADLADEPAVRTLLERGRLHHLAAGIRDAVPLYRAAYRRAVEAGLTGLAVDAAHMLSIALPDQEHEWVRAGLSLATGSSDPLVPGMVGALLTNLGFSYVDEDRWDEAVDAFRGAVAAYRRRPDPRTVHTARWTHAWALRALGRHREALVELRELAATRLGADDARVEDEIAENERAVRAGPQASMPLPDSRSCDAAP
jgi:tetratricopeptide (TPR) repeat protein